MKHFILLIIIIFNVLSCKQKKKDSIITNSKNKIQVKDTIYCNQDKYPIIDIKNVSMYNEPYMSIIKTNLIKNKEIVYKTSNSVNICLKKKFNITLIKQKKSDTIFSIPFNMEYFREQFQRQKEAFVKKGNKLDINLEHSDNLKLDSIKDKGLARTSHKYYDCYFSNYQNNKKYKVALGIDYLNKKGENFLLNQLEEIKN